MTKKIYFLIVFLSVFFHAYSQKEAIEHSKNFQHSLLNKPYQTAIYKANLSIYKHSFSGIYLFKQNQADSSFRIVMLSEFGLSFFDFEYKNQKFTVKNCQEFFNKPLLIKLMQSHITTLLKKIENKKCTERKNNKNKEQTVYRYKEKCHKYDYFYNLKNNLEKVEIKRGLFKKEKIEVLDYKKNMPSQINIMQRRGKIRIELKLLEINR